MKARITATAAVALAGLLAALFWTFGRPAPAPLIADAILHPLHGGGWALEAKIDNRGGWDVLLGARSPEAEAAGLVGLSGDQIALPAAATASLSLDGIYLRLDGLEGAGTDGRLVPFSLIFERGGAVSARARIAGDTGGAMGHAMPGHAELLDMPEADAPALGLTLLPEGDGWSLSLDIRRLALSAQAADSPHRTGQGHGHLYLNGLKLGRLYAENFRIGALPPGQHRIRVSLNTNDHRPYATGGAPIEALALIEQHQ